DEPITAAPFPPIARYDSRSFADQQHRPYSGEGGRQRGGEKGAPAQARPRALPAAAGPARPADPAMATDRHHPGPPLCRDSAACPRPAGARKPAAPPPPPTPTPPPPPPPPPPAPPPPTLAAEPASHCTYTPSGSAARKVSVPPARPAFKAAKYQATVKTNRGTIVLDLLNHQATCTVNSFIHLPANTSFTNTPSPRLTT